MIEGFSPLAGIRIVARSSLREGVARQLNVSVPLRGLGSWQVRSQGLRMENHYLGFSPLAGIRIVASYPCNGKYCRKAAVSVPLRGLGSWQGYQSFAHRAPTVGFSPLAGIRIVASSQTA